MAQDALRAARACPCPDCAKRNYVIAFGDPGNHKDCPYSHCYSRVDQAGLVGLEYSFPGQHQIYF